MNSFLIRAAVLAILVIDAFCSIKQSSDAIVNLNIWSNQLLEVTITADYNMRVLWMQCNPARNHIICFCFWMSQHGAVGATRDELYKIIHDFKEHCIFFNLSWSAFDGSNLPVSLVWSIDILTPTPAL